MQKRKDQCINALLITTRGKGMMSEIADLSIAPDVCRRRSVQQARQE